MDNETLTGMMFDYYREEVGGKTFDGLPLPTWKEFRENPEKKLQSDAWVAMVTYGRTKIEDACCKDSEGCCGESVESDGSEESSAA